MDCSEIPELEQSTATTYKNNNNTTKANKPITNTFILSSLTSLYTSKYSTNRFNTPQTIAYNNNINSISNTYDRISCKNYNMNIIL